MRDIGKEGERVLEHAGKKKEEEADAAEGD